MPIHLDKIAVKNLGPLPNLDHKFGLLNLFYGKNETGKTYLVEFLLGAIFNQAPKWDLRESTGSGSVTLKGLAEKPLKFTQKSRKKIEEYWEERELGLPLNMAKLLVVKGGELHIADIPGGINKNVLKSILTNEAVLSQIQKSIPLTIQDAILKNQEIQGPKRGVLKNHQELFVQIEKLHRLLEKVEDEYSRGPVKQIDLRINAVQELLAIQEEAKEHHLYNLIQESKTIQIEKEKLSDQVIEELKVQLHDNRSKKQKIADQENLLQEKIAASQHYLWLDQSISIWERQGLADNNIPDRWIIYGALALLAAGLTLIGINELIPEFNLNWFGIPSVLISSGLISYLAFMYRERTKNPTNINELQAIRAEYKTRFGDNLRGLSVLREKKEQIQKHFFIIEPLENELQDLKTKQVQRESDIQNLFETLTGKQVRPNDWQTNFQDIIQSSKMLTEAGQTLLLEIERLNVSKERARDQPANEGFSAERVIKLQTKLDILEKDRDVYQQNLENLKQLICQETHDEITIAWQDLLFHLRTQTLEKEAEYKAQTARLVAMIGVNQILQQIAKEEDQKIIKEINTPQVMTLLKNITGTYESIELIDDQLYINDPFSQYTLSQLSTGAKEQILLALRLGMAVNLTKGDPLFLILDDAFQHSDWNHRETLVKLMVDLAKNNWQVTYLTMDDHIRDLFLKYGKADLKSEFTYKELK